RPFASSSPASSPSTPSPRAPRPSGAGGGAADGGAWDEGKPATPLDGVGLGRRSPCRGVLGGSESLRGSPRRGCPCCGGRPRVLLTPPATSKHRTLGKPAPSTG
ncbi:hypothetical protein EJB05_21200, partial [Eragrostis curvula]